MRILYLTHRVPYPPNRGDKITTWNVLRRLLRRHEVTCLTFRRDPEDEASAEFLRGQGAAVQLFPIPGKVSAAARSLLALPTSRPLTFVHFSSPELQRAVDERIPRVDLAYAYSASMGPYLLSHPGVPRIMHFADLDSQKWRQLAARSWPPWSWIYWREQRTLLAAERRIARAFDASIVCTAAERAQFDALIPGAECSTLPNGVDLDYFRPVEAQEPSSTLVFTGVMDYGPNADACVTFVRDVLPLVQAKHSRARFVIVGSRPTRKVRALGRRQGVEVTGFVPDVRVHLRQAAVVIATLRIAQGIQNKALEAMAVGLPVLVTTQAGGGIGGKPGRDYLVADDPREQAEAILHLLADGDARREFGRNARAFVEGRHDWERILDGLDALLERVASRRVASPP